MKKTVIAAVMVMAMTFLLISAAMAETSEYVVKKGDCLSVIGQRLGVKWQRIAELNKIKPPYIIYLKQRLLIKEVEKPCPKLKPEKIRQWKNVGGNPYKGIWQWAIDNFNLPDDIKCRVKENISKEQFKWLKYGLGSGQELEQAVFGNNQIWGKTICYWDPNRFFAAKDYGVDNYHVIQVLECKNWAWYKTPIVKIVPKDVSFVKAKKPEIMPAPVSEAKPSFPPLPVFSIPGRERRSAYDKFDWYMGGGNYKSVYYDAQGHYWWTKGRFRPFEFKLRDNLYLKAGIFGFGAIGDGDDGDYDYRWKKWAIGPTFKLIGSHWDSDLDFGLGRLYNKGGIELYRSRQIDNIFLFSAHGNFYQRRDRGKRWFPKTELNFELTLSYREWHDHSWNGNPLTPKPYDNRSWEIFLTQGIYDFDLNNHLRLTPGFNLGFIREYGRDDPNFLQFGPMAVLSWHNEDIISISFLNYKENLGGDGDQWHKLSGWAHLIGLVKAYKASQITEAVEKDLKI